MLYPTDVRFNAAVVTGIMDLSYISLCYKPPVLHTRCFPSRRAAALLLVKPLSV